MKRSVLAALLLAALVCSLARATETENFGIRILPAPGKVTIDGKTGDWDLTGGIFVCSDPENLRDKLGCWIHLMYDKDYLYVLARWTDETPLNNPSSSKGDFAFKGDCLQLRFITHDGEPSERTLHPDCWRDRDKISLVQITYGKKFNQGRIKDAARKGAKQAFEIVPERPGYNQEVAFPWALLTSDGKPLSAGSKLRLTVEPNFTAGKLGRVSMKDIFHPSYPPDRVFTFQASRCWGIGTLERKGNVTPQPLRLSDAREFKVTMKNGEPAIDWTGLIQTKELRGFKEISYTMPADGYISLNILGADKRPVRQLLNQQFRTAGHHTVKWDGLTTPVWDQPGDPVAPGIYRWKALVHKGIGLRFRGWASNAGSAPWDANPRTNWGGDHGQPVSCAHDGKRTYLGWSVSEAGRGIVTLNLKDNVAWRHKRGGFGGAHAIASDGTTVYIVDHGAVIYRLDAKKGVFTLWKGRDVSAIAAADLWPGAPSVIDGLAADKGKLYVSMGTPMIRAGDVVDWPAFLKTLDQGKGLAGTIKATLGKGDKRNLGRFMAGNLPESRLRKNGFLKALNAALQSTDGVPGGADLGTVALKRANYRRLANAFPGALKPAEDGVIAVLDADSGKLLKRLPLTGAGDLTVRPDGRLLVLADGDRVLTLDPDSGKTDTLITGLANARGIALDKAGNVFVSVRAPVHQVRVFSPEGKPLRAIGRPGGRPLTGPWVPDGFRDPAGITIDARGRLWVAESEAQPKRFSIWDPETGKLQRELFGPTHYGAGGGTISPIDPNIMVGEGCEWRLDPKTGRAVCTGVIESRYAGVARFAKVGRRLFLVLASGLNSRPKDYRVFERLGEGRYTLRAHITHEGFWSDLNGDGKQQPAELDKTLTDFGMSGYIDLSLGVATDLTLYGMSNKGFVQLPLKTVTPAGAPVWDTANARKVPGKGGHTPNIGNTLLFGQRAQGHYSAVDCFTLPDGKRAWWYPSTFTGVHGSHKAPPPEIGLMRGVFGCVGAAKLPAPVGDLFCLNGNSGEWHLLTGDGFYLTRLFQPDPMKRTFPENPVPGAILDSAPPGLGGEDFGGSFVQGDDGKIYIQCGKTGLWNVEVVGLDTVRKIDGKSVTITPKDVAQAAKFRTAYLQEAVGTRRLGVARLAPEFNGNIKRDFKGAQFIEFQKSRDTAVTAAATHDAKTLYLGWHVRDASPWVNAASAPEFMYARGDTVDFRIAPDPNADPKRGNPAKGDLRLTIGPVGGKPVAVLYRFVSDEKKPKIFSSGIVPRFQVDYVAVIDARITVKKGRRDYTVEAAVPLAALGLAHVSGKTFRGDFGVTHGGPSGDDTALRTQWNNQATGITDDEVYELKISPKNWGQLKFD